MSVIQTAPHKIHSARDLWREVTSGELLDSALRLNPGKVHELGESARSVGNGLKDAWREVEDGARKVLHLPAVERRIDPQDRETIASVARGVGTAVGYGGAGVLALAGIAKLASGVRHHEKSRVLEGLVDLGGGAAVVAAVAAWGPGAAVLAPLAAALGGIRGGYNAWTGYRAGASRNEIQGFLDGSRAAATFCRLLGGSSGILATTSMVLGPIACGIQAARGFWDLSTGLKESNNEKKLQGLADVVTAVGMGLSLSGALTVPGVALVVVASAAKIGYQFSGRARRRLDHRLDRMTPTLGRVVGRLDRAVDPVLTRIRPWIERITGVHRGEDQEPGGAPAGPGTSPQPPTLTPQPPQKDASADIPAPQDAQRRSTT